MYTYVGEHIKLKEPRLMAIPDQNNKVKPYYVRFETKIKSYKNK